jgi:hypothetical protein
MHAAISSTTRGIANSYRNADSIFTFTHASLSPVLLSPPLSEYSLFSAAFLPLPPHILSIFLISYTICQPLFSVFLYAIYFHSFSLLARSDLALSLVSKVSYFCYKKVCIAFREVET